MNVHNSVIHNCAKLSADEQINKMWYIHIMKYYLAIKRNKVLIMLQHGS